MAFSPDRAVVEASREVRAHALTSILLVLVTLAMTAATLVTVGRSAAAERDILAGVDAAGPRLISVTVLDVHPGTASDRLSVLGDLPQVEWVLGLGPAQSTAVGATGRDAAVATRALITGLPDPVRITTGRDPRPGEAIVSGEAQAGLRLLEPAGALRTDGRAAAVVGGFSARGLLADLDRLVLLRPAEDQDARATLLYVLAREAAAVPVLTEQLPEILGIPPDALTIGTSEELLAVNDVLTGQVGALARQIAVGVLALGLVLVLLTVSLALSSRRADMGRRRALGSSRSGLVALVLLMVGLPAAVGAALGALGGLLVLSATGAPVPGPEVVASLVVLVLVAAALASLPAALAAAFRDPVAILRVA